MITYACQNPACGETWDQDENGGLHSSRIHSGHWDHKTDSTNCPQCDGGNKDWRWVEGVIDLNRMAIKK